MRCLGLGVVFAAGCNAVFRVGDTDLKQTLDAAPPPDGDPRIDLDQDGIKDVADPCIAPDTDALIDTDTDGVANGVDLCPFDMRATVDTDQDGIGNNCDPSPAAERTRCIMAFSDPELDVAMWRHRDDPRSWQLFNPRLLFSSMAGSIVADWSFESSGVTTFAITGQIFTSAAGFTVLARGGREPSPADIGCHFASGIMWLLSASEGATATLGPASPDVTVRYRLQMTLRPRATDRLTLRCTAQLGTGPIATSEARVAVPEGTLGFVSIPSATVDGIVIYERDDAQ